MKSNLEKLHPFPPPSQPLRDLGWLIISFPLDGDPAKARVADGVYNDHQFAQSACMRLQRRTPTRWFTVAAFERGGRHAAA